MKKKLGLADRKLRKYSGPEGSTAWTKPVKERTEDREQGTRDVRIHSTSLVSS